MTPNDTDTPLSSPAPSATTRSQPIVESHELFRGTSEILISHDGAIYRMRITRQGKLILNK
ncbi:hemin uptake protein HemP [Sinorhizobium americanum]|uniref:Hemin uptake protein n=1 Tax=Sinorhizobium americanum TaxID=194963 RepID=A0A1L3LPR8_9HYPH|nr:hemin uptake protein HemP [Sinorhizobium americanum]APG85409.1 hemin uptake protein [Sinorhizobium americanum CCGM7]APG92067.1 hemin uptake protein [Sinorhizobium americanum]